MKNVPGILLCILFSALLSITCFSQAVKQYEAEWKKIDELIQKKGLPKSALDEVKKLYARAKKEGQPAQIIKALVYMAGLQQQNREDNQQQSISEIEKELTTASEPAASILKSLLADLYWQYFQQHRWQLYNRTNTVNFQKEDIATWTIEDFHRKISELYLASIEKDNLLKSTRLEPFEAIIVKGNVRNLRPTLYDLLAHKALDYFSNDEQDIKKPAFAFEINNAGAFAPAENFVKQQFPTRDSLSLRHKALLLYQGLINFHLSDAKPDALVDVDIARIQFVYQNSVSENKDVLYQEALERIFNKYPNLPVAAQAGYLLAAHYETKAASFKQTGDSTHRYSRVKAKELLERIVKDSLRFKGSEGWTNSFNLLQEITKPQFSFQVEKVNVPEKPFRALVKYKGANNLYFRLIKTTESIKNALENLYDDKNWNVLIKASGIKSWRQPLPATDDLQEHSVEIKLDALPVGEYVLLASSSEQFDTKKNTLGAGLFYVSNISYVGQHNQYFVLHRETGQPLANASVAVYVNTYNYQTSRYTKTKKATYQTDRNGYFKTETKSNEREYGLYLDISHKTDRLFLDNPVYHYYSNTGSEKQKRQVFFFTDRSIYRPGQTVYFKGIVINTIEKDNKIIPDFKTTVYLQNANGEITDSLSVTTNEYGSFSGRFALPQNLLNGEFSIYSDRRHDYNHMAHFSVEEYKRPKFYVEFNKPKASYKVGDSITVIGNAKAYAGNTINAAKISYRIVRQPRFPYPWLYKGWMRPSEAMEIAHGEAITDASGVFKLNFKAIPDLSIDQKLDPVFDYLVTADVTDINGETRTGEIQVSAGYKSLLLNVKLEPSIAVDSLKNIFVRTENMAGEFVPSMVSITLSKLVPENRLIRKRYWEEPDQFIMSKEEFIKTFPHDEYKNESDFETWEKGAIVWNKSDSVRSSGLLPVEGWQPSVGFYQMEIVTKDKDGKEVKDVRYLELYDPRANNLAKPEYLWTKGSTPIEPGETTTIQIGSSANNVFVVEQVDKKDTNDQLSFVRINEEKKTFSFGASEKDRGGYGVTYFFIKDNRFYQFNDIILVPWSNKELAIEYTTFRDKTLPGSEEKWKIKITGYKGEKLAAEMLASMYDASLDQFRKHNWNRPNVWATYNAIFPWSGNNNFIAMQSNQGLPPTRFIEFRKQYDALLFHPYEANRHILRGKAASMRRDAIETEMSMASASPPSVGNQMARKQALEKDGYATTTDTMAVMPINDEEEEKKNINSPSISQNNPLLQPRKNFNETAFFFPDLKTYKDGNIEFAFTTPEALTRWKLQTLTHTKELAFGLSSKEMITQKELMVQPNLPRFLREGDRIELSAKIANLSDKELTGQAELQLLDASTNQPVDGWFQNMFPNQYFTVAAKGSEVVKFPIEVPYNFNKALVWRIVARSGNFSDGEEAVLPVLTNKMLVTETMPLPMKGTGTKNFVFEKLAKSNSETLQHHALTIEYTSNPAWYAVQALPYLMEYPYECAEQIWNRYYANAIATKIVNAAPRIKQIFEQWKIKDTSVLLSNLQKNEELKSVLLQETPWVMEAKTEEQQKKNIALLFDAVRMSKELKASFEQLKAMQSENGGFVWFKGGPDDRYITQYIVTGIGHLKKLGAIAKDQQDEIVSILRLAIPYLDKKLRDDYANLIKKKADLKKQQITYLQTQYLYMRSFFPEQAVAQSSQTAYNYFKQQAKEHWTKSNKYAQGMTALALYRSGDVATSNAILKSLKESSINHEELGMYWKGNSFGYSWYWWYAPIETQALLIEAFAEISKDTKAVDDLKTWLLKNKQTNNWRTTKATADACYALLLQGTDWLNDEPQVSIQLGNTTISNTQEKNESGTGYFKRSIEGSFVKPEQGNISVSVKNTSGNAASGGSSWGAVYWQYFEDIDKITPAATPLKLNKKLFIEKNTDRGPVLTPIAESTEVKVGDKIKVRVELRVDRDMEYVHMKDMRSSGTEPVNVLSGYKWQGGLGYYETTKDASTNFFFNYLPKGTYVFEYPLFVSHAGKFSNGITSVQCMYAPEFSAHSEGVSVTVQQ